MKIHGRLIGTVELFDIDAEQTQAEMDFWIGFDWRGQGNDT